MVPITWGHNLQPQVSKSQIVILKVSPRRSNSWRYLAKQLFRIPWQLNCCVFCKSSNWFHFGTSWILSTFHNGNNWSFVMCKKCTLLYLVTNCDRFLLYSVFFDGWCKRNETSCARNAQRIRIRIRNHRNEMKMERQGNQSNQRQSNPNQSNQRQHGEANWLLASKREGGRGDQADRELNERPIDINEKEWLQRATP